MKTICLYLQMHQPLRLKKYRFFNMGKDVHYLDDFLNKSILQRTAANSYRPMNELLLKLITKYNGKFKISISITGITVEQLKSYAPDVLKSFKKLAETGCVEFIAETYPHSLTSLIDKDEFQIQVKRHVKLMQKEFDFTPTTFRNTELIYSDGIGEMVADMGFTAMITEGAKHILGWKSPDFLYVNAINPRLKLLLRNIRLSQDLRFRFSDTGWDQWPLTADKYINWIKDENRGDISNIFIDYETFGECQNKDTGIFEFMEYLADYAIKDNDLQFGTPQEIIKEYQPVATLHVPYPISWTDEERDTTAWFGNEMQNEAISKLYAKKDAIHKLNDKDLNHIWDFMQSSNHFYYMSTKWFSDGSIGNVNPYGSPYEAFINYMNILSDFIRQIDEKGQKN